MPRGGNRGVNVLTNILSLGFGFLFGIGLDYIWFAYDLPGSTSVRFKDPQLTDGDFAQLLGEGTLATFGFVSSHKLIAPFAFGMLEGGIYSKLFAPRAGLPRYLLADTVGGSSILSPTGLNPNVAKKKKTGQAVK